MGIKDLALRGKKGSLRVRSIVVAGSWSSGESGGGGMDVL